MALADKLEKIPVQDRRLESSMIRVDRGKTGLRGLWHLARDTGKIIGLKRPQAGHRADLGCVFKPDGR